jgi:hypothetical protein
MPDDFRRIIDRDVAENLRRFRNSDFEARLRRRLGGTASVPAARTRRLVPAFAWNAGAVLVLAAAVFLSIGRPDRPMISLAEIEQALRRAPALQAIAAEARISGGPGRESPLSRALAGALNSVRTPAEENPAEEPPRVRDSAVAFPEDSKRTIETTIRDRVFERVLIKYSNLNREV